MMDFFGYSLAEDEVLNADKQFEKFEKWHNRIFKKLRKPLSKKVTKRDKRTIFKLITALGTYIGVGTMESTAVENAILSFERAYIQFKEKRNVNRQNKRKGGGKKTKVIRFFNRAFLKN